MNIFSVFKTNAYSEIPGSSVLHCSPPFRWCSMKRYGQVKPSQKLKGMREMTIAVALRNQV